ncbi:hypothetical protein BD413DRAFT_607710 [Trametes elegans]|nr:hypothetical protein BD413DRAFT_607710 [Trametes elegans]
MHSVKIRRPDSVGGAEDADPHDLRIVVGSLTAAKAVRFKSPPRSPRTSSLLMALGDVIQQDEEDGEWEEEESGEQESCSGETESEGRQSGEYAEPPPAAVRDGEDEGSVLFSAGRSSLDAPARPAPILGLSEDARQLLVEVPSPEDERPTALESFLQDESSLVDSISPRSSSPNGEQSMLDDEETTVLMRRAIIPEFPAPPSRAPSPRRDSASSGLLSPIEITPAPPISLPRHVVALEESIDSGYADGPAPMCATPPRSPRRVSTLSLLSSPFGSPSARVLRFDPSAAPVAALFSPRFGSFSQELGDHGTEPGPGPSHSRHGSVDTLDLPQEVNYPADTETEHPAVDGFDTEVAAASSPSPVHTRHSSVPEGSSLFRAVHSPVYPPLDESMLQPGDPSFGEDDTMSSLYDQYYTPTTHSTQIQPLAPTESVVEEPLTLHAVAPAPLPVEPVVDDDPYAVVDNEPAAVVDDDLPAMVHEAVDDGSSALVDAGPSVLHVSPPPPASLRATSLTSFVASTFVPSGQLAWIFILPSGFVPTFTVSSCAALPFSSTSSAASHFVASGCSAPTSITSDFDFLPPSFDSPIQSLCFFHSTSRFLLRGPVTSYPPPASGLPPIRQPCCTLREP